VPHERQAALLATFMVPLIRPGPTPRPADRERRDDEPLAVDRVRVVAPTMWDGVRCLHTWDVDDPRNRLRHGCMPDEPAHVTRWGTARSRRCSRTICRSRRAPACRYRRQVRPIVPIRRPADIPAGRTRGVAVAATRSRTTRAGGADRPGSRTRRYG